tara:strand:- start:44 stop:1072 length:1029 start_codon:yes stop_codon:yes gene_type:complete
MIKNLIKLEDIQSLTAEEAAKIFPIPTKYNHIPGVNFKPPQWLKFKDIRTLGTDKNIGRTQEHTQEQIQQLAGSFAKGVQTWQDLPCAMPLAGDRFSHVGVYGFGRAESIESLGLDGYWFHVLDPLDHYSLSWVAVTENLELSPKFTEDQKLLIHQICNLVNLGTIQNTEDAIEAELDKMVPHISNSLKGRIREAVFAAEDTPLRYTTWGQAKVKKWLREVAAISFETGGAYDKDRDMYGFLSKNVQDPLHQAIMKYQATKKKSYVVLHTNAPNSNGNLSTLRMNETKKLADYIQAYKSVGMTEVPLKILGFMYQDNSEDMNKEPVEDKRYLVDVNGTTTIK